MPSWISTWNHGLKVRNPLSSQIMNKSQFDCDNEHNGVITILSMKTKAMKDIMPLC